MTNFEKIKSMTVEEFAEFMEELSMCGCGYCECYDRYCECYEGDCINPYEESNKCVLKRINWLNKEVEE